MVMAVDPNDPRLHPEADHLSSLATSETISAAEANQKAIEDVTVAAENLPTTDVSPTVAEQLAANFVTIGTDVGPEVPYAEPAAPISSPSSSVTTSPSDATTGVSS